MLPVLRPPADLRDGVQGGALDRQTGPGLLVQWAQESTQKYTIHAVSLVLRTSRDIFLIGWTGEDISPWIQITDNDRKSEQQAKHVYDGINVING